MAAVDGDAMIAGKSKKFVTGYAVLAAGELKGAQVAFLDPS